MAAQYSTDPTSKDKGGLRTDVVPGSFQQPLDDDIFKAPTGQVQGPVVTSSGSYVFEVISATPEKVQGFDDTAPGVHRHERRQDQRSDQVSDQGPAAAGGAELTSAPTSATTGPT